MIPGSTMRLLLGRIAIMAILALIAAGNRAVIVRIAWLVKIVPREFLLVSCIFGSVLSLVFGKSEMAGKDRDFVGATLRNGISDGLDAAWCLSIERERIAIYRLRRQRSTECQ